MNNIFDDQRVRIALFVVLSTLLIGLFIWTTFLSDSPETEAQQPRPQQSLEAPDTADDPPGESEAPIDQDPPDVTKEEVTGFLEAYNTFSWRDDPAEFVQKVVTAGAVLGSKAASPPYEGEWLTTCIKQECATEFVKVNQINLESKYTVTARVEVMYETLDYSSTDEWFCTLTLINESSQEEGKFTDVVCLGPEG